MCNSLLIKEVGNSDWSQFGYDYDSGIEFGRGYRFKYEMSHKGKATCVAARVVEVKDNGRRVISFEDSNVVDEILHVNDIRDFEELPMFKYTLRVGDTVRYENEGKREEVVTTIAPSAFLDTTMHSVLTTDMFHPVKGEFTIVESQYKDAPPKGKRMYLNGVNLELGKLANASEIRKLRRRRSAEHIDQSEMGDVGRKMYVAVHSANYTNKIMKDPDEHFDVKEHGDKAREIMANMEGGDDPYSTQNLFDGTDDEDSDDQ